MMLRPWRCDDASAVALRGIATMQRQRQGMIIKGLVAAVAGRDYYGLLFV